MNVICRGGDVTTIRWKMLSAIEKLWIWAAFHAPKQLAYWCAIRLANDNGDGSAFGGNPCERTITDVLKSHNSWAR